MSFYILVSEGCVSRKLPGDADAVVSQIIFGLARHVVPTLVQN